MATIEEEYVEGEDFDEEDEDAYEYEEEDGEVEDADDEEDAEMIEVPEDGMINIPGLGALPIRPRGGAPPAGMGRGGRIPMQADAPQEWKGLRQHPANVRKVVQDLLSRMADQDKAQLTILLLGKTGVGKSSTVNSILAESAAQVVSMQAPASRAQAFARQAGGFTLTLIDTPGILEGDAVDGQALGNTLSQVRGRPVDVVLFLNRLDEFRVDASDIQVLEGITERLGSNIWSNAFVAFTHAKGSSLPDGLTYDEFVAKRAKVLRDVIRKHGANKDAELPVALIENSSRAPTNDAGEKLLGNKRPWLTDLMTKVADKAMQWTPYSYSDKVVKRNDPNKKRRWLIPLILAAQVAFKILVLDRVLEEDGVTGDAYGPYEKELVAKERERVAREKQRAHKRKQASKQQQRRLPASSAVIEDFDDEDDYDEDDDF